MQYNCVFKAACILAIIDIGSFVSTSQSIVLLLAPAQIIANHWAPLLIWNMDVRRWLRPTLYYLDLLSICRTTYRRYNNGWNVQQDKFTTSPTISLQQVVQQIHKKSGNCLRAHIPCNLALGCERSVNLCVPSWVDCNKLQLSGVYLLTLLSVWQYGSIYCAYVVSCCTLLKHKWLFALLQQRLRGLFRSREWSCKIMWSMRAISQQEVKTWQLDKSKTNCRRNLLIGCYQLKRYQIL